jgi:hypothetical protein
MLSKEADRTTRLFNRQKRHYIRTILAGSTTGRSHDLVDYLSLVRDRNEFREWLKRGEFKGLFWIEYAPEGAFNQFAYFSASK